MREQYRTAGLDAHELADGPMAQFGRWFAETVEAGLYEPNAMVVSTVSPAGQPSARMVLLKGFSGDGFVFFTNLRSRKGEELVAQPRCSLLFPWHSLERQVRVEGTAEVLARDVVAAYFATRPRGAQLGAHASHQSSVVASREELDAAYMRAEQAYPDDVPVPDAWGGFRVRPVVVEFWQGRPGRMHDRLVYRRAGDGWRTERLAP
jgi:pyridoxamine 5'-phosphate oxidase